MKTDPRQVALRLIEEILSIGNRKPSALALEAGISPSTVTRFLAGEDKNAPSLRTIVALADVVGAEISLGPPAAVALSREAMRISIGAASRILANERADENRLADLAGEIYEWLAHQEAQGEPIRSVEQALSRLGPLVRRLSRPAPAGPAA